MWAALAKIYWKISVFKQTPDHSPYSLFLLIFMAIIFTLIISLQWTITDTEPKLTWATILVSGVFLSLSYAFYTSVLLSLFKKSARIVQTLTSLFACHTIVHFFAFPLILLIPLLTQDLLKQPIGLLIGVGYLILTLMLTIWQFMLTAFIYRQALAIDFFPAVLASLGLMAENILIISLWR